jgi:hypothetical protein
MVHRVTRLINSLPKQNGLHSIISPREIITGKKLRCPSIRIGQYIQGHTGGTNSTDQERLIDSLYIGRAGNTSGHEVFKLNTKQVVSVNRVTVIPTSEAAVKIANDIGEQENQPEGVEFSDMNGRITLQDFADNANDDDSNASDDDFVLDKEYKQEEKEDNALDAEEGIIGDDDPDLQEVYFQTVIQQHNTNVSNNNEPTSVVIRRSTRNGNNPIVTLSDSVIPGNQECDKRKKKKDDESLVVEEDLEEDPPPTGDTKPISDPIADYIANDITDKSVNDKRIGFGCRTILDASTIVTSICIKY